MALFDESMRGVEDVAIQFNLNPRVVDTKAMTAFVHIVEAFLDDDDEIPMTSDGMLFVSVTLSDLIARLATGDA